MSSEENAAKNIPGVGLEGIPTNTLSSGPARNSDGTIKDPLVWVDCEMTGLNPDTDEIIEIFCLITDGDLNLVDDDGWGCVVHQTKERMDQMDEWCTRTHGESGLTASVIASQMTPEQAADDLLAYIQKHVPKTRTGLLAGNSIHQDRAFLTRGPYKKVTDHLHYRMLDVSSIKEAARRWAPKAIKKAPSKRGTHTAKQDILESIEEAHYYKTMIFESGEEVAKIRAEKNRKAKSGKA